jgi:hypothetical protein
MGFIFHCLDIKCERFHKAIEFDAEQSLSFSKQPDDRLDDGDFPDREFRGMGFDSPDAHCTTRHLL